MRSLHTRRFVSVGFISDVHQLILEYSFFSEVKMNPKRIAAMWLLYRRLRRRRIKRNYWVHPINQKREQIGILHTLLKELQKDENKFFNFFRMTIPSFNELHQRLKTKILRKNSKMRNSITSEERLALTLSIHPYAHPLINLTPSAHAQVIKNNRSSPRYHPHGAGRGKPEGSKDYLPFPKTFSYFLHWSGLFQICVTTPLTKKAPRPSLKLIDLWPRPTAGISSLPESSRSL
ncbi:hypothetical protein AVEN_202274-1 [Araneus ventricosus]|uniref:Uncharacterized protein n=1 Tax=Araneus ventricosus TaxID=182803 RepID=A0A4Y2CMK2_ARAVE|nr:hypothetical protein AVEN_202274-1 [Araneus ventricosus]